MPPFPGNWPAVWLGLQCPTRKPTGLYRTLLSPKVWEGRVVTDRSPGIPGGVESSIVPRGPQASKSQVVFKATRAAGLRAVCLPLLGGQLLPGEWTPPSVTDWGLEGWGVGQKPSHKPQPPPGTVPSSPQTTSLSALMTRAKPAFTSLYPSQDHQTIRKSSLPGAQKREGSGKKNKQPQRVSSSSCPASQFPVLLVAFLPEA